VANVAEQDEVIIACSVGLVIAASLAASTMLTKAKKKQHATWVKQHVWTRCIWSVQYSAVGVGNKWHNQMHSLSLYG